MRTESDRIYQILNANADLTALVSDKIFPLVAHPGAQMPFVNYYLSEEPSYSKSGKLQMSLTIDSYADDYNEACTLSDTVKAALENMNVPENFEYQGSTPNYSEEKLIYIQSNYKFKIQ